MKYENAELANYRLHNDDAIVSFVVTPNNR